LNQETPGVGNSPSVQNIWKNI